MSSIHFGAAHAGGGRVARNPAAVVPICLGIVLAVVGIAVLAKLPWDLAATSFTARSWPAADAKILSVSLDEQRHIGGLGGNAAAELVLSVTYEYEVAGEVLTGEQASLIDRTGPRDRRLKSLYRRIDFARITGQTLPAYYDPDRPARAFLETALPWRPAALDAVLGVVSTLFGLGLLAHAWGRRAYSRDDVVEH